MIIKKPEKSDTSITIRLPTSVLKSLAVMAKKNHCTRGYLMRAILESALKKGK